MSEYDEQAQTFLDRFGLKLRATHKGSKCPQWDSGDKRERNSCPMCGSSHGDYYRVTLSRRNDYTGNQNLAPKRVAFDYWGSQKDKEDGKDPTAYDVLACISGDIYCPEDFEEFCGEYGYETDSRKAKQTFRRCNVFGKRLRAFFTGSEQEALSEIR